MYARLSLALAALAGALALPVAMPAAAERTQVSCSAPAPAAGTTFRGTVLHIPDSHTLCVASGPTPREWVRVSIDTSGDQLSRRDLMSATFAKVVVCRARGAAPGGGVTGECTIEGQTVQAAASQPVTRISAIFWR
jgi:hypothetical protein